MENNDSHNKNRPMPGIGGTIGADRSASMSSRPLNGSLAILAALIAGSTSPASAVGQALLNLGAGMQPCIETSSAKDCQKAGEVVKALQSNSSYQGSSHLCKEEISELAKLVQLLPMRDAVPNELMASVADVQQACLPFGF